MIKSSSDFIYTIRLYSPLYVKFVTLAQGKPLMVSKRTKPSLNDKNNKEKTAKNCLVKKSNFTRMSKIMSPLRNV